MGRWYIYLHEMVKIFMVNLYRYSKYSSPHWVSGNINMPIHDLELGWNIHDLEPGCETWTTLTLLRPFARHFEGKMAILC